MSRAFETPFPSFYKAKINNLCQIMSFYSPCNIHRTFIGKYMEHFGEKYKNNFWKFNANRTI